MDAQVLEKVTTILKALEAGYAMGPAGTSTQGAALQRQDLQGIMNNVTYQSQMLVLSKVIPTRVAKSMTVEYRRQLSYGGLQGVATVEVSAGKSITGDYESLLAAMAFYTVSSIVSFAATQVQAFDNVQNEQREAHNAAMVIGAAVELDLFRGHADFSNAGVFDGAPSAMPLGTVFPGMIGLDPQIRQANLSYQARSLDMFEYGAGGSTILSVGGTLAQANIEDGLSHSVMNFGEARTLYLDPLTHAAYNKIIFNKEHSYVNMGQMPPSTTGAVLTQQWTANGQCTLVTSRFLSGKTSPPPTLTAGTPSAPTVSGAAASSTTGFLNGNVLNYFVTSVNEQGEGVASSNVTVTLTGNGQQVNLSITAASGTAAYWFNVYSTGPVTASVSNTQSYKFIGRVKASATPTTLVTTFSDLGNFLPSGVTGFLLDKRNIERPQLSGFSRLNGAVVDTALRNLFVQAETIIAITPAFNVLLTNLTA